RPFSADPAQRQGVHGRAYRFSDLWIVFRFQRFASPQRKVVWRYSTETTALPDAAQPRRPGAHSAYWKHCSLTAKSKYGLSADSWERSFFSPTLSPWACAMLASRTL